MTNADCLVIQSVQMPNRREFLVYDLKAGCLVENLTDYGIFLSRQEQLDEKTILTRLYHLKRFYSFARRNKIDFEIEFDDVANSKCPAVSLAMCDALLTRFRDVELDLVQNAVRSKNKIRTSMETVNTRLRAVYAWLCWLQQDERIPSGLIGPRGARVRSTLTERGASSRKDARYKWSGVRQTDYPLLFRRTGKASKHKRVFVPSDAERLKVVEMMQADAALPFVAHRNVLIVDIANATGLRRASINSLLVEQFSKPLHGEFVYVVPSHQKFNYEDGFSFPAWLYLRIQHYIKSYLSPMVTSRGWTADQMRGRLFLSSRAGRPLEDRTLTQVLGRYMRQALDAPPGTAVHAFRHRFINVSIREEISYRLAAGLDTSTDAIAAAVGLKVGHRNIESLRPYVIYQQSVELARKEGMVDPF